MSCRVDSTLIAGACIVGDRGLGVLGSVIRSTTATGAHGAGFLYNDWQAGDDAKEFRGVVVTPPAGGTLVAYEDGSFDFTAPADGSHSFTYRLYVDGADLGTAVASFTIGTVSGATVSVSGTASYVITAIGAVAGAVGNVVGGSVAGLAAYTIAATGAVSAVVSGNGGITAPSTPWDAFEPYVLPYAPGCPDGTMTHHVRQAAIRFLARTFAWQTDLPAILADGASTVFAMPKPAGGEVCKLLSVTVYATGLQPRQADLVTPEEGATRIRNSDLRPCAFTGDLSGLVVWPAQPAAAQVVAAVALKPTQLAAEIPAVVFDQYASDIAAGALASLLSLPKQDWTDMQAAAINASQFNTRMATVARIVARGGASSGRRSALRWF